MLQSYLFVLLSLVSQASTSLSSQECGTRQAESITKARNIAAVLAAVFSLRTGLHKILLHTLWLHCPLLVPHVPPSCVYRNLAKFRQAIGLGETGAFTFPSDRINGIVHVYVAVSFAGVDLLFYGCGEAEHQSDKLPQQADGNQNWNLKTHILSLLPSVAKRSVAVIVTAYKSPPTMSTQPLAPVLWLLF